MRIIPRLDIKGPNLVKGIHLEGLRVMGKPEAFARHYYENGADELFYMDVVASLYERNSLAPLIEKTSREIFMPLTVGGGLRTLEDIDTVLRAGADKVALNTAAIRNPEFIKQASNRFGSSTIVVSIEAMKRSGGNYEAFTDNGRMETNLDVYEWALRAAELGAGELLITSIDNEGTGKGFDGELIRKISEAVSIPVIACGGAGKLEHISEVVTEYKADAVSMASVLHYQIYKELREQPGEITEGNTNFLNDGEEFTRVDMLTINEIKSHLREHGLECRDGSEVVS